MGRLKRTILPSLAMAAICVFISNIVLARGDDDKIRNIISAVYDQFTTSLSNGDEAGLAALYAANARILQSEGKVIEGIDSIRIYWREMIDKGLRRLKLETLEVTAMENMASEIRQYQVYGEGEKMISQGKFIVIWKKEDGQWKLFRDVWNADLAAGRSAEGATDTTLPAKDRHQTAEGDTVWVVMNFVKPDMRKQFEQYIYEYLMPAVESQYAEWLKSIRFLLPNRPNDDSTFTYIFLVDPVVPGNDYIMKTALSAMYGEEKGEEYLKVYYDCLAREWVLYRQSQSEW